MGDAGMQEAIDALRELKRACQGTYREWNDPARKEWDSRYYEPTLLDASRVVEDLTEVNGLLDAAIRVLGRR